MKPMATSTAVSPCVVGHPSSIQYLVDLRLAPLPTTLGEAVPPMSAPADLITSLASTANAPGSFLPSPVSPPRHTSLLIFSPNQQNKNLRHSNAQEIQRCHTSLPLPPLPSTFLTLRVSSNIMRISVTSSESLPTKTTLSLGLSPNPARHFDNMLNLTHQQHGDGHSLVDVLHNKTSAQYNPDNAALTTGPSDEDGVLPEVLPTNPSKSPPQHTR